MTGHPITMKRNSRPLRGNHQRGFAIMVLLALLAVGILYAVISLLDPDQYKAGRAGNTDDALAQAKAALIGYAATYRDTHPDVNGNLAQVFGYLPCPDVDGDGQAELTCDTAGKTVVGLLPYQTLGLPELRDSSGNCLWYAVSGSHKNNPKTAPLNWDTQGLIQVQDANAPPNGPNVLAKPDDANGGVVAIIFAAGPPLPGQNRTPNASHACNANPAEYAAYLDGIPNSPNPNTAYTFPSAVNTVIKIAQGTPDIAGATNNDRLVWITPKEIFDEVIKRADISNGLSDSPVGQINKLADLTRAAVELLIQNDLTNNRTQTNCANGNLSSLPNNCSSYGAAQPNFGKFVGDLSALTSLSDPTQTYPNYLTNWSNQFRQVICSSLSTPCLTINGVQCRGALLFGGRATNNQPRPNSQQVPSTANLNCYFESTSAGAAPLCPSSTPGGLDILNSAATSFIGSSAYAKASPTTPISTDFATCLFPGTFLSFAQNIGAFAGGVVNSTGGSPVASVSAPSQSATLGSSSPAAGSGCIWYPSAIPLNSMMRVYFRFQKVIASGDGFTVAIADASTNNPLNTSPNPIMCGAANGKSLGYAGAPPTGQANSIPIASVEWGGTATIGTATVRTATITTVSPHGLHVGDSVTISGGLPLPAGYVGTFTVVSVSPTSTTQFTYVLPTDPGPSPAGIKAPKLGVEFDTHLDNSNLDPTTGDHVAFVYWGSAADSTPTGSGNDDNIHYAGILGSGAEPLNPRELNGVPPTATPIGATLSVPPSTTISGLLAGTATTALPHGFAVGQWVNMTGFTSGVSCNGLHQISSIPSATSFVLPAGYPAGCTAASYSTPYATPTSKITAACWSSTGGGTATVTTSAPILGLTNGQYINIANIYPAGYDGTYQAYNITSSLPISGASWSSVGGVGIVTVATKVCHGLTNGQTVTIAGTNPAGYGGAYPVIIIDSTHFKYSLAADPGGSTNSGSIAEGAYFTYNPVPNPGGAYSASAKPGIVTATTLQTTYLSAGNGTGTIPATTASAPYTSNSAEPGVIHVRLDLSRGYNPTTHQATLYMKAYVADTFQAVTTSVPVPCTVAHFMNLSQDLSSLCTEGVYIEQEGIPINDVAAPVGLLSASWSSTTNFVTASTGLVPHGLKSGQMVNIAGASLSAYNGSYQITVVDSTHFRYFLVADPGGNSSGGTAAAEALSAVYFGFTAGQGTSSSDNQDVVISNLLLRSQ